MAMAMTMTMMMMIMLFNQGDLFSNKGPVTKSFPKKHTQHNKRQLGTTKHNRSLKENQYNTTKHNKPRYSKTKHNKTNLTQQNTRFYTA